MRKSPVSACYNYFLKKLIEEHRLKINILEI